MSRMLECDFHSLLTEVKTWEPQIRLLFAEELLHSLRPLLASLSPNGVPAEQVLGIGRGDGPPLDDEAIKRLIHEHRMEKYG